MAANATPWPFRPRGLVDRGLVVGKVGVMSVGLVVEVVCRVLAGAVVTVDPVLPPTGRCMTGVGRGGRHGLRLRQRCQRVEPVGLRLRPSSGGVLGGDRGDSSGQIRLRRHRSLFSGRCVCPGRRVGDYDPTTGTFLTRDPLDGVAGTPTVANPYHYADNDPLNKTDPTGMEPTDQNPAFNGGESSGGGGTVPQAPLPAPPSAPPAAQPSDCVHYESGRIGDYIYGRLKPPCGFHPPDLYDPETIRGFQGNAVLVVGSVTGPHAVDRCSGKVWAELFDVMLAGPIAPFEVDRAYEEFDTPCRAHDYAYDLIRLAAKQDGWWRHYTNADLIRDRADADSELRNISTGVCNDTPWIALDIWIKSTCWRMRGLMYNGLRILTAGEGLPH